MKAQPHPRKLGATASCDSGMFGWTGVRGVAYRSEGGDLALRDRPDDRGELAGVEGVEAALLGVLHDAL